MSNYVYAIKMAFLIFPLLALLVTLPYIISQYRKYGSLLMLRSVIIYSFILYLLVIYFLVILPLPPISEVEKSTAVFTQLEPFYSFFYLKENIYFKLNDFDTYWNLFGNSYFYQVIYNIFITIPFGIYLRYYFKYSFKKTLFFSFLLSLFFELTQLSGLYGIYPRPYRIFDVDDLITNTLGGAIGYLITPILCCILPPREKIDETAYLKGKKVGLLRRGLAFFIDLIFLNMLNLLTSLFLKNIPILHHEDVQKLLLFTLYFIVLPLITKGNTIGRKVVNIKVVKVNDEKAKWYQYVLREYGFLFLISLMIILTSFVDKWVLLFIPLLIGIIYFYKKKDKRFPYELISKTKYQSTIEIKEEIIQNEEDRSKEEENVKTD